MKRWYTVKVKYTKKIEKNGQEDYKQVNESFLLPAVSCTDAEVRITKEISSFSQGEFLVSGMSVTEITDIFRNKEGGQWYICKIVISEEDDKGKTSKTKQNYMVEGFSVKDATKKLEENLSDAMFDYETTNVDISPIIDVFHPYIDVTN